MQMSASVRSLALTAHVTTSVGWIGAVACFLALAIAGLTSAGPLEVQAAYLAMEMICWAVIVPLSLLSPATGIVQSLWTPWGLVRHYWVLVKLLVTLPCTAILLLHMLPTTRLAAVAAQGQLQVLPFTTFAFNLWPTPRRPLRRCSSLPSWPSTNHEAGPRRLNRYRVGSGCSGASPSSAWPRS